MIGKTRVHAPADLRVGDLVVQQMWSPTDPRWSSTIEERIASGHRYGEDRVMQVAGIVEHYRDSELWRSTSGFVGPMPLVTRWWLVDPDRPNDKSRMSWVESDWCVLLKHVREGALW